MKWSEAAFLVLLGLVGIIRLIELGVSRRHQRRLIAAGATRVRDSNFRWMAATHMAVLAGAALEVTLLERPFLRPLAAAAFALFLGANVLRFWVIRTLKTQWTVQVVDATNVGVVTRGPYRHVRHPNYSAVFVELLVLPLIHTAWTTAVLGSAAHAWALSKRLSVEEPILMADPNYRKAMAHKPRFLPGLI